LTSETYESIFGRLVGFFGRGSARSKAATTQKNADTHPFLERDSNPRSQCSSGRRPYV